MSLICTADRDGEPSSMFQNGIIVHYDTQEHTSWGFFAAKACCGMEPIYEPTGPGTNSKYEGAVIWIIYTMGAQGERIFNKLN